MILIADISSEQCSFEQLKNSLADEARRLDVQIRIQRSEIFEAMHQI